MEEFKMNAMLVLTINHSENINTKKMFRKGNKRLVIKKLFP